MTEDLEGYLKRTRSYWDHRAVTEGTDAGRVEFSERTQRMRFESFLRDHDLEGRSILDVGCGMGGLLRHLSERDISCEYVGFDISPEMIERCRARYPGVRFESGDFLGWEPGRRFDYSVAFGIHNLRFDGAREALVRTTRRQHELTEAATHVSLLTDRFAGFAPHIQAWSVEDVLGWALETTPFVALRHDYLPNDFSVTLYHAPAIDTERDLRLSYADE